MKHKNLDEQGEEELKEYEKILLMIKNELPIEESNRSLIKIMKKKSTNKLFPRKYNDIKKKPL